MNMVLAVKGSGIFQRDGLSFTSQNEEDTDLEADTSHLLCLCCKVSSEMLVNNE